MNFNSQLLNEAEYEEEFCRSRRVLSTEAEVRTERKKRWGKKAAWCINSAKAVAVCSIVALVRLVRTGCSHQSCSFHDRLSGDEDLHMIFEAGDRGLAHWRCGQEQISVGRVV